MPWLHIRMETQVCCSCVGEREMQTAFEACANARAWPCFRVLISHDAARWVRRTSGLGYARKLTTHSVRRVTHNVDRATCLRAVLFGEIQQLCVDVELRKLVLQHGYAEVRAAAHDLRHESALSRAQKSRDEKAW